VWEDTSRKGWKGMPVKEGASESGTRPASWPLADAKPRPWTRPRHLCGRKHVKGYMKCEVCACVSRRRHRVEAGVRGGGWRALNQLPTVFVEL
jgi:hypothetical protein